MRDARDLDIIRLRGDGVGYRDIAAELGITCGAVKRRIERLLAAGAISRLPRRRAGSHGPYAPDPGRKVLRAQVERADAAFAAAIAGRRYEDARLRRVSREVGAWR